MKIMLTAFALKLVTTVFERLLRWVSCFEACATEARAPPPFSALEDLSGVCPSDGGGASTAVSAWNGELFVVVGAIGAGVAVFDVDSEGVAVGSEVAVPSVVPAAFDVLFD
jgi:hypothetical protein